MPQTSVKNPFSGNKRLSAVFKTAAYYHRGQERKDGLPYITHPVSVARMLKEAGYPDEVAAAGLLHDVLEDTGCELEDLEKHAGRRVARIVCEVTDRDKTAPWLRRKQNYLAGLKRASRAALAVACADKADNIASTVATLKRRRDRKTFLKRAGARVPAKIRNYAAVYRLIESRYSSCPLLKQYRDVLSELKSLSR